MCSLFLFATTTSGTFLVEGTWTGGAQRNRRCGEGFRFVIAFAAIMAAGRRVAKGRGTARQGEVCICLEKLGFHNYTKGLSSDSLTCGSGEDGSLRMLLLARSRTGIFDGSNGSLLTKDGASAVSCTAGVGGSMLINDGSSSTD